MKNPMLIWYFIVGLVLLAFVFQFVAYLYSHHQRDKQSNGKHLFGYCKEQELFYVPGDRRTDDEDDFEDL